MVSQSIMNFCRHKVSDLIPKDISLATLLLFVTSILSSEDAISGAFFHIISSGLLTVT